MTYYLGLDVGTSGTKALLITEAGLPVASDTQEYPLSTPRPLWAEQNPEDWWQAVVTATRNVLEKADVRGRGDCGDRAVRADARVGVFGQRQQRAAACAALVRSADAGGV